MFPTLIRMRVVNFLLIFILSEVYGQDRKITAVLNPGCDNCDTTLVYINATGSHDSIHQIWDFSTGEPTIIFVIGTVNSTLEIQWKNSIPFNFILNEEPKYSFSAVMRALIEYDDLQDTGRMDSALPHKYYPFRDVVWQRTDVILTEGEAKLALKGKFKEGRGPSGTVGCKLDLFPFKAYAVDLPHLIHTANSSLMDISLVNLTTDRRYNASRFALRVVLASTDDVNDTMRFAMRKSMDDEHTPGVFEIVEIKTPESWRHADGGFVQYRPVAYNQPERGVTSSTNVHTSNFNKTKLSYESTAARFYKGFDPDKLLVQYTHISFGETGDGYYEKHNYTSWSFTLGYGSPPLEGFSTFVVIIICLGLGIPLLLASSGVTYVLVQRYKSRNNPTRFTDDD